MDAWIPFLPLIGVVIGLVANPVINVISFYLRRKFEHEDRERIEAHTVLKSLQEAILNQAAAIAEYQQLYLLGRYQREPDHEIELAPARMKMATAELQVRLLAAQVGDDELWQMINTPLSDEERITEYEKMTKETGNIRQQSDQWNARIRELYKKL